MLATGRKSFEGNGTLQDWTYVHQSWEFGAGGIVSTVDDLAQWARALYGGQVLSEASMVEMMNVSATGDPNHQYCGLDCIYNPGLGYGH